MHAPSCQTWILRQLASQISEVSNDNQLHLAAVVSSSISRQRLMRSRDQREERGYRGLLLRGPRLVRMREDGQSTVSASDLHAGR